MATLEDQSNKGCSASHHTVPVFIPIKIDLRLWVHEILKVDHHKHFTMRVSPLRRLFPYAVLHVWRSAIGFLVPMTTPQHTWNIGIRTFRRQAATPFHFLATPDGNVDSSGADSETTEWAEVTSKEETFRWSRSTPAFRVVRHFAEKNVDNDAIRKLLETHSITTLEELGRKMAYFLDIVRSIADFSIAIDKAMKRNKSTIEDLLGGELIYDKYCITRGATEYYEKGAVSVDPEQVPNRGNDFSLVLGPSGSGKTVFAIFRLHQMVFPDASDTEILVVHFQADQALNDDELETNDNFNVPKAIASLVEREIERKLSRKMQQSGVYVDDIKIVQLCLHVVVDEAGGGRYKPYFGTLSGINAIVAAVKEQMVYKFTGKVHVSIVGTGLETTTDAINSRVDCTKFRMQPWTCQNFDAMVDASSHSHKSLVKEVVHGFPILVSLISNARCGFYLLESMTDYSFLQKNRVKQFVDLIISIVAETYISSNRLSSLRLPTDKWRVAKYVFQAVDKAARNPTEPFIPNFEELESNLQPSIALSLISINVETRDGKAKFMTENDVSVSMSPFLAIVLANLLNTDAIISWNWQAFSTTVTLCEWKQMIVQSISCPTAADRSIVELRTPFPITSSDDDDADFTIPLVDRLTVVLNGPAAPYADVIAPFRLVHVESAGKGNEEAAFLDLLHELGKMGLTTEPEWRLQQAVTSIFDIMWESEFRAAPATKRKKDKVESRPEDQGDAYYPYNSMVTRWVNNKQNEDTDCQFLKGTDQVAAIFDETERNVNTLKPFNSPITAVFATNCKRFVLKDSGLVIDPSDVDWEGNLKEKKLPNDMPLRPHVRICFIFC
jgi:hypothetical protein